MLFVKGAPETSEGFKRTPRRRRTLAFFDKKTGEIRRISPRKTQWRN
jgi:hypothetical protein